MLVGIQNGVYVGKGKKMGALITDTIPLVILRIGRVESGSVVAPFFLSIILAFFALRIVYRV